MALTGYQREVCRLLADNRVRSGESFVAGGVALNEAPRAGLSARPMVPGQRVSVLSARRSSGARTDLAPLRPRDFVDTLTCHRELQPLGFPYSTLASAAAKYAAR